MSAREADLDGDPVELRGVGESCRESPTRDGLTGLGGVRAVAALSEAILSLSLGGETSGGGAGCARGLFGVHIGELRRDPRGDAGGVSLGRGAGGAGGMPPAGGVGDGALGGRCRQTKTNVSEVGWKGVRAQRAGLRT